MVLPHRRARFQRAALLTELPKDSLASRMGLEPTSTPGQGVRLARCVTALTKLCSHHWRQHLCQGATKAVTFALTSRNGQAGGQFNWWTSTVLPRVLLLARQACYLLSLQAHCWCSFHGIEPGRGGV